MSLLVSERVVDLPAESPKAESDSDSGVGSPMDEAVADTTAAVATLEAPDSDDDIVLNRKSRSRKVLQDSDSDGDAGETGMAEALVLEESSIEKMKTTQDDKFTKSPGKKRISRHAMDSDESEPEKDELQGKPNEGKKKREKSQRRKEKEKNKANLLKRLKGKASPAEKPSLPKALNDSGCLLNDNDLFDAQLEDDTADGEMEEEESLYAIRNALKQKSKHNTFSIDSEEDEQDVKPHRMERKAARASKEAMKQLHSDSQRIIRESAIGLPYHMPEPKGIDQFFKKRNRPDVPAMALLKSAKYQASILEASAAALAKQCQSETPEQSSKPEAVLNGPNPNSCTQREETSNEGSAQAAAETTEDQPEIIAFSELQQPQPIEESSATPSVECPEGDESPKQDVEMLQGQQSDSGSGHLEQTLANQGTVAPKPKKDKLARLRELGLEPPPVAKLCADDGGFVQLEPPQVNPALEALKERFLRHVQPAPRTKAERALNVSVVRKDSTASGQEELHAESITVVVNEGEEEPVHTKPGEKLVLLKSRLQQAMAIRRQEERERRAALYRLDNEDCEEEEEAEMTESEDEEGVDDLLGGGEDGEEEAAEEAERCKQSKTNDLSSFKSPSPTPDADGTLMLFAGSSCSRTGDGVRQSEQVSQENEKMEDEDALTKDNSHNSSFELTSSNLPSYQPVSRATGKGLSAAVFRSPSPCFFRPSFLGSASKSSGKLSEPSLTLPVEDSQDLYGVPSPEVGESRCPFSLEEDTQSQLLDSDGFLNVGPRGGASHSHKRQLLLDNLDENAMDANMDELLGLCSGGFGAAGRQSQTTTEDELLGLCSGTFSTSPARTSKPINGIRTMDSERRVEGSHGSSDADMDQLLALCSGKFTGSPAASPVRSVTSPPPEDAPNGNKVEEEDNFEFHLMSDVESNSEKDEAEEDSEAEGEDDDEETEAELRQRPNKRKIRMTDFVESEAELSGSDVGSEDEDDDGGDEYEEEELQEELPSDEELLDQVNKIHMKQVLDDDKRKLRLYQERYLADGDLHSDGPGRERRFRWKNIDDGYVFGLTDNGEEEEEDEEVDQNELQRNKERLEREQWLREQTETGKKGGNLQEIEEEEEIGGEDSHFMKLAKKLTAKALQKKETASSMLQKNPSSSKSGPFQRPSQSVIKRGSLLSQPQAVLQKLANISDGNPLAPRNTRGFLFQTLSPEKEPPSSSSPKKQFKKRSQTESSAPAPKRPCRSNFKSTGTPRSIFSFLEN